MYCNTISQIALYMPMYFITFLSNVFSFSSHRSYGQRLEWEFIFKHYCTALFHALFIFTSRTDIIYTDLHGLVSDTISICKQERHHYVMRPALFVSTFCQPWWKKSFFLFAKLSVLNWNFFNNFHLQYILKLFKCSGKKFSLAVKFNQSSRNVTRMLQKIKWGCIYKFVRILSGLINFIV